MLKHAACHQLRVERSLDFLSFMAIAETNLQARHGGRPLHTAAEMQLLAGRFPDCIKLYTVNRAEEMLGGVIIYESQNVAHGQYRNATAEGMKIGALDLVVDVLMNDFYREKPYIDFGTSMLENGRTLNTGLIYNKESCGGRATVYDSYELDLKMGPA